MSRVLFQREPFSMLIATHAMLTAPGMAPLIEAVDGYATELLERMINPWPCEDLAQYYDLRSWLRDNAGVLTG